MKPKEIAHQYAACVLEIRIKVDKINNILKEQLNFLWEYYLLNNQNSPHYLKLALKLCVLPNKFQLKAIIMIYLIILIIIIIVIIFMMIIIVLNFIIIIKLNFMINYIIIIKNLVKVLEDLENYEYN